MVLERRGHEARKQRVRSGWPGPEFRVELTPDVPRMIGQFDHFHE
jgi:hypothetical protein